MRGHDVIGANLGRVFEQQFIAGLGGALLNSGFWLDAIPDQNGVRQRKTGGPAGDHFGLAARVLAQSMVDGRDIQRGGPGPGPRPRAHPAASNIKATESGPPETPRTIPRAASQGLKRATMLPAENPASTDARDGVLADLVQTLRAGSACG